MADSFQPDSFERDSFTPDSFSADVPNVSEQRPLNAWKHPLTEGLIGQGVQQVWRGVKQMIQPGMPAKYAGASDVLRGTGKALAPVGIGAMLPALVHAPLATGFGLVGGAVGATVGGIAGTAGAQYLDASPEAQQLSGDVGALAGGIGGGYLGSKLPSLFRADPRVAITRSLRPVPSNPDFSEQVPDTLSTIKALNPGFKPKVENGQLNLVPAANKAISAYQDALEPWLDRMEGTRVDTKPIIEATQRAVSDMLPSEQSGSGSAMVERAKADYPSMSPRALRDRLALLNQRLASFYNGAPNRQSAALADLPENVLKAQRDAVADTLYRHLDPENAGAGPRLIQSKTGNLIDLRDAAVRRQNAIVAEQPLSPIGRFVDPAKKMLREINPFGKATGSGIAYAEGSEGRSLPLLKRAFGAVSDVPGANEFGSLPRPGPRMLPAPADTSGALPQGIAGFRSVGSEFAPQQLLLPPASSQIGVSGVTVPDILGRSTRGVGSSTPLLPPPTAGNAPQNVLPRGPGSIGPAGTAPIQSTETGIRLPSSSQAHIPLPASRALTIDDIATFAQKNLIPFTEAAQRLRAMGFTFQSPHFARGGIVGALPPRVQIPGYARGGVVEPENPTGEGSGVDIIRGSSDIPLSPEGQQQALKLSQELRGKATHIFSSDLKRAAETAMAISSTNPQAGKPQFTPALRPWHLGEIEGQPTEKVLDRINQYIAKKPDEVVPGRGKLSTSDGESFNQFKDRFLGHLLNQIANYKPGDRLVNVTHYRDIRAMESWLKGGAKADKSIDAQEMMRHADDHPGKLIRLDPQTLEMAHVANANTPGIYFARHGKTAFNGR